MLATNERKCCYILHYTFDIHRSRSLRAFGFINNGKSVLGSRTVALDDEALLKVRNVQLKLSYSVIFKKTYRANNFWNLYIIPWLTNDQKSRLFITKTSTNRHVLKMANSRRKKLFNALLSDMDQSEAQYIPSSSVIFCPSKLEHERDI